MTITEKEIIKLGNLAKIGISDDEAQELEIQLTKILNFFEKINNHQSTQRQNLPISASAKTPFRQDEVTQLPDNNDLLKNAPSSTETLITVPLVIE